MRPPVKLLALALLVAVGGCDLLRPEPDNTVEVAGRVIVGATAEPVVGLGVSLGRSGGFGINHIVAVAQTGPDGAFRIMHDPGEIFSPLIVTVNDQPYDGQYGQFYRSVARGQTRDFGTIELTRLGDRSP